MTHFNINPELSDKQAILNFELCVAYERQDATRRRLCNGAHVNSVENTQSMHNQPTNSASLILQDSTCAIKDSMCVLFKVNVMDALVVKVMGYAILRMPASLNVGEIGSYLGGAARRYACSHGWPHTLFFSPALANLSPTLKGGKLDAFRDAYGFTVRPQYLETFMKFDDIYRVRSGVDYEVEALKAEIARLQKGRAISYVGKGTHRTEIGSNIWLMTRLVATANTSAPNNSYINKQLSDTVKEHTCVASEELQKLYTVKHEEKIAKDERPDVFLIGYNK
ncbi:hypothetical protein Tco_0003919 [Tanacetum coccineum]